MSVCRQLCAGVMVAIAVTAAAAEGADRATPAENALSLCLTPSGTPIPVEARPVAVPPGLARATQVEVALIPGSGGRLFVYRGLGSDRRRCDEIGRENGQDGAVHGLSYRCRHLGDHPA